MIATVLDNGRTLANQAVLQTINVFDPCIFQKDAMLHNGRENAASISYGGERPDERILDLNVISDDHRSSDRAPSYFTVFSQANSPTHLAFFVDFSYKLPLDPFVHYNAVRGQEIILFTTIKPPTIQLMAQNVASLLQKLLDRICDLQFSPPRWPNAVDCFMDPR